MSLELADTSALSQCLKQERKVARVFHRATKTAKARNEILAKAARTEEQRRELADFLTDTGALEVVFKALANRKRLAILQLLFEHATGDQDSPMAYTELRIKLNHMASGKLAYHLNQLQEAGLVRQVTRLSASDVSPDNRYHSFYRASALSAFLLEACRTL